MRSSRRLLGLSVVGLATLAGAAVGCPGEAPTAASRRLATGGLTLDNGLVSNGLFQDLASVALTKEGLAGLGYIEESAQNEGFATLLEYIATCALTEDQELTIGEGEGALVIPGGAGLAPEWADGPCEEACQEWVSACLLARTNIYGIPVQLYLTGPHPSFGSDDPEDLGEFDMEEGAFYGNLFQDPPREYACRGAGYDPYYRTLRVCAQPTNRCGIQYVGACGDVDGETGEPSLRHACEAVDGASRLRCHNRASLPGSSDFPEGTHTYERVLTVYLPRSSFQAGIEEPCAGSPPTLPVPAAQPGSAGATCANDDDCRADLGLFCDARHPQGLCTTACEPSADPAAEEAQCGEGGTCLARLADSICTAPCAPEVPGGSCAHAQVCTSFSIFAAAPDDPGCSPWCSADSDCPTGLFCGRFGVCETTPVDLSLLADGEPCEFPPGSDDPLVFCRGMCIRPTSDPKLGLCATLINLAVTAECPDGGSAVMTPLDSPGDDLGLCAVRKCQSDADCTAPLTCLLTGLGKRCAYLDQ